MRQKDLDKVLRDLEEMQKDLAKKSTQMAQSVGKLEGQNERLEKEFGFQTVPAAKKALKSMITEYEKEQEEILQEFNELKGVYSW